MTSAATTTTATTTTATTTTADRKSARRDSSVVGAAIGSFDTLHVGHLRALREAATRCDELVIGIASDKMVQLLTGAPPVVSHDDRREVVAGFGLASCVEIVGPGDVEQLMSARAASRLFVSPMRAEAPTVALDLDEMPVIEVIDVATTHSESLAHLASGALLWGPAVSTEDPT